MDIERGTCDNCSTRGVVVSLGLSYDYDPPTLCRACLVSAIDALDEEARAQEEKVRAAVGKALSATTEADRREQAASWAFSCIQEVEHASPERRAELYAMCRRLAGCTS